MLVELADLYPQQERFVVLNALVAAELADGKYYFVHDELRLGDVVALHADQLLFG
ncbi:hypothetical protein D3C87_1407730 [compost metagenome]